MLGIVNTGLVSVDEIRNQDLQISRVGLNTVTVTSVDIPTEKGRMSSFWQGTCHKCGGKNHFGI